MKNTISLVLLTSLAFSGLACGGKTETSGTAPSAKPSTTTPAAAVPANANICQKKGLSQGSGTVDDPCQFVTCQDGQWCNPNDGGMCEADPCKLFNVHCPGMGEVCKGGTCYDPQQFLPWRATSLARVQGRHFPPHHVFDQAASRQFG